MIMRCKKRFCSKTLRITDIFHNSPCNTESVKCTCSAADLIEDQKRVGCCIAENVSDLIHLDHKCTLSACQIIRRADTCKDTVHNTNICRCRRNVASNLRHQNDQRSLSHIGRFTCHIRSGNDRDTVVMIVQVSIIIDKHIIDDHFLNNRMSSALDVDCSVLIDLRTAVIILTCDQSERNKDIDFRDCFSGLLDSGNVRSNLIADFAE